MEDWEGVLLQPSYAVEKVWVSHILDTKNYFQDTTSLCGREIIYDPDAALDPAVRQSRVGTTKIALKALFGVGIDDQIWDFNRNTLPEDVECREEDVETLPFKKENLLVYVKDLSSGGTISANVHPHQLIYDLKEIIQEQKDLSPTNQRLVFEGNELDDGATFNDYEIKDKSTIYLILQVVGKDMKYFN
eukprot:CAMPEP_0113310686 /NCGR_PEP_ID=MMETSP0010_2-20120614/8233_1 /TAXON_ID=216773 ORGANISM="Corethron hystrix, Strain 308" /NCGR_SAMPLE_ID=MMETSP0010_2 /ASSEMBLY_ACC=CAM_ASM_000155 /LENGTH=188 /DNA_ID=CAMNT_0000166193 /DNA_START=298 /DNA_END=864 /DNA_ORIENTATION=- /assembly_acc=CAM_ASM_000155